jgi:predicted ArsR family transcriptional regulator
LAMLDERQRRLFAGLLAMRRGHGGILQLAEITGLSRTTIRRGIAELRRRGGLAARRIRKPGGGRKLLEKKSPRW